MDIKYIDPKQLKFAEYNPRKISDHDMKQLKKSIADFGFVDPVIVNQHQERENIIIGGHQRVKAALALKYDEVPVYYLSLDHQQEKELNVRLNKNTGEWDWDLLEEYYNKEDLLEWGFEDYELDWGEVNLEAEEDHYEIPEDLIIHVNKGDLIEIGEHRLFCGDSSDSSVYEKLMNGIKVNLVFTDPPYGVSIGAKNRMLNSFLKAGRNLTDIKDDSLSPDELKVVLVKCFMELKRNMNDSCSIYVTAPQVGDLGMMMMMMMQESGLTIRHVIIWLKNAPTFSMGRLDYEYKHEPILYTWNKNHKFYGKGEFKNSVWEIDKPRSSKEHPTMKPIKLIENCILNSSVEGDIVSDIFLGSGSTMVACHQLNRICYGIEIEPHYCQVIIDRMLKLDENIEVKINGKPYNHASS